MLETSKQIKKQLISPVCTRNPETRKKIRNKSNTFLWSQLKKKYNH